MREYLIGFNKAFESKARLGIMSVLMVNDFLSFNALKELLNLTDGNLATHLRALEEQGYLSVQKQFVGRKPNTTYAATEAGKKAFAEHLNAYWEPRMRAQFFALLDAGTPGFHPLILRAAVPGLPRPLYESGETEPRFTRWFTAATAAYAGLAVVRVRGRAGAVPAALRLRPRQARGRSRGVSRGALSSGATLMPAGTGGISRAPRV